MMRSQEVPSPRVPSPLSALAAQLAQPGQHAWLVGEPLHQLLRGDSPMGYQVTTSTPLEACLDKLPHAVLTRVSPAILTLPTPCGTVDICPLAGGTSLESQLQSRDFTLNAMAWDLATGSLIDPFGGERDIAARIVRSTAKPRAQLDADPACALRAARTIAVYGYRVAPELEEALAARPLPLRRLQPAEVRPQLMRLLAGDHAAQAVALLQRCKLAEQLIPGANTNAAAVIEALSHAPADTSDVALRLAAWLPPREFAKTLVRWRIDSGLSQCIQRLLGHHPLDVEVSAEQPRSLERLLKRVPRPEVEALFRLRQAELSAGHAAAERAEVEKKLDALRAAIRQSDGLRTLRRARASLQIDGREVMETLGQGPGRHVGEALDFLAKQVATSPSSNTPEALRARLQRWKSERSA